MIKILSRKACKTVILIGLLCSSLSRIALAENYQPASIIQIMANPEKYDGKAVSVIGFMHLEFEGDVIYLHKEDWVRTIVHNGIGLNVEEKSYGKFMKINNNYVVIDGIFSSKNNGHLGVFPGTITKITRVLKWNPKTRE